VSSDAQNEPKLLRQARALLPLRRRRRMNERSCNRAEEMTERTERNSASASPHNGLEVHLRGQGPRAEADAAHGLPACESRDAGRAPP